MRSGSIAHGRDSCRRKDSLPTSPSTLSLTLSRSSPHISKRPENNRILSAYHAGSSDPDPTEWKPSEPRDPSEWKPPIPGSGKSDSDLPSTKTLLDRLSKTTENQWKPKLPHRGSSDAYKYLSGFHKELPQLGSARTSASASRTSLASLTTSIKPVTGKDICAMITAVNAIGEFANDRGAGGAAVGRGGGGGGRGGGEGGVTCTTTRSAPSLSHTPITSTDDEDSSLASTPSFGPSSTFVPVHGGGGGNDGDDTIAVGSASSNDDDDHNGSTTSSPDGKPLHIVPSAVTAARATKALCKTSVAPVTAVGGVLSPTTSKKVAAAATTTTKGGIAAGLRAQAGGNV